MNQPVDVSPEQQLEALLDQYWECAFDEGQYGRKHDTEDGKAQRTLSAIRALFKAHTKHPEPLPAQPPVTYRVYVQCMRESHRLTYLTTLESSNRPKDATLFDTEGIITPLCTEELWQAEEEAQSWAEFLGVKAEPFAKPDWHDRAVAELEERARRIAAGAGSSAAATAESGALVLSHDDIQAEANRHITAYLFPGDCYHSPDVLSMARADRLGGMLRKRMQEMVADGIDPRGKTLSELLPGVRPDDIEVTESDFL